MKKYLIPALLTVLLLSNIYTSILLYEAQTNNFTSFVNFRALHSKQYSLWNPVEGNIYDYEVGARLCSGQIKPQNLKIIDLKNAVAEDKKYIINIKKIDQVDINSYLAEYSQQNTSLLPLLRIKSVESMNCFELELLN